jgi:hypothetical protein
MQSRLEAMATEVEHSDPEALPAYEAHEPGGRAGPEASGHEDRRDGRPNP